VWFRLIVLVLAPYAALLPLLLATRPPLKIERLSKPRSLHPCEGAGCRATVLKRAAAPDTPDVTALARRGWRRLERDDVLIESNLSPPEMRSLAELVTSGARGLEETFGISVPRPVKIVVHDGARAGPRVAPGWDVSKDEIVAVRRSTVELAGQLMHWLVHRALRGEGVAPWLEEGLAELAAGAVFDHPDVRFDRDRREWKRWAAEWRTSGAGGRFRSVPQMGETECRTAAGRARAGMLLGWWLQSRGPWPIRLLLRGSAPENLPGWSTIEREERDHLERIAGAGGH
jgi:hypothetical protein